MGVSIDFYVEVRKDGQWHPFVWRTPMVLKRNIYDDEKGKDWDEHECFDGISSYLYEEFLFRSSNSQRDGLPEDVSPRFKKQLSESGLGCGYFDFEDLVDFCNEKEEEMFSKMEISSEHQLHKQLDRIETLLRNKTVKKKQERDDDWYAQYTVREIFDNFNENYEPVLSLRRNILVLLRESDIQVNYKDIRVLFSLN